MNKQKAKWNLKFSERENELLKPDKFLTENLALLKKGKLADVACGDGRNAVYLAENGFDVSCFDFSEVAFQKLNTFTFEKKIKIETTLCDLETYNFEGFENCFDSVLVSHFLLQGKFFENLKKILKVGGTLVYSTFNLKQHEATGFRKEFCLQENEILEAFNDFELVKFEQTENEVFLDNYILRKRK